MSSLVRFGSAAGLCFVLAAVGISQASAAGFMLREQDAEGIGSAFAGSAARGSSPATIWFNPAAMTLLSGNQIGGSTAWIAPRTSFKGTATAPYATPGTKTGGDAIIDAAIGSTYAMWSYSNDLKFGVAVTAPFGLRSDYPADWMGRYWANHSAITNINFNPNVAYRVNSNLSLGAGVSVDWIDAKLSTQVNQSLLCAASPSCPYRAAVLGGLRLPDGQLGFKGDDIGVGFNLGALWEFSPQTRVGFSYRSQIAHMLSGNDWSDGALATSYAQSIAPNGKIKAGFSTPANATVSLFHQIDDRWSVMADVQWTGWSSFRTLTVTSAQTGAVLSNTIENWRDTWFVSLGANYKVAPAHTLHFGVAYDQSAIDKATDRSVRVPDSDRYWVTTGWSWEVAKDLNWHLGYAHLFAPKVDVNLASATTGTIVGTYSGSVDIVSTSFSYKF